MAPKRKKLGTILVDMGATTYEALQRALRQQLEEITQEFLTWDSGYFSFKFADVDRESDDEFFDEEAKLTEVINIDPFILDLMSRVESIGGGGTVRPTVVPQKQEGKVAEKIIRDLLDHILEPGAVIDESIPFDEVREWPGCAARFRPPRHRTCRRAHRLPIDPR